MAEGIFELGANLIVTTKPALGHLSKYQSSYSAESQVFQDYSATTSAL